MLRLQRGKAEQFFVKKLFRTKICLSLVSEGEMQIWEIGSMTKYFFVPYRNPSLISN
jgi:hypothetical protein